MEGEKKMKDVKVEFRCTEEEKKKLYDMAERKGLKLGDFVLNSTINKRGRCGLDADQKSAVQRMKTSLNKIESGIDVPEETDKIIKEARELCQSLKL